MDSEIHLTRSNRQRLAYFAWLCALGLFGLGVFAAHEKGKQDKEREAQLAIAKAEAAEAKERAAAAELELHHLRNDALSQLREEAGHVVIETDHKGVVTKVDGPLPQWTGVLREKMVGTTLESVMFEEDYKAHMSRYPDWIQSSPTDPANRKRALLIECNLKGRNGEPIPVLVRALKIATKPPRAVAIINRAKDITMVRSGDKG